MYDINSPVAENRRLAPRFPLCTYLNQYVLDNPYRAVALDVSEAGLSIRKPIAPIPHAKVVGLELQLPGSSEIIWASAEPRFHAVGQNVQFSGLHFLAMAGKHERLLRDYVRDRHDRWLRLFTPRPVYFSRFGCQFS